MPTRDAMRIFLNWARERIDEMDATLTSLEGSVDRVLTPSRTQAQEVLAGLRTQRDAFRALVTKQGKASATAHATAKTALAKQWGDFENRVNEYFETLGRQTEQQQVVFE